MSIDVHNAAQRGNVAAITEYIRMGGDLYAQDKEGNPPLHVASYHGCEAAVAALLGAGVDPDALNMMGKTPLHYAEKNGHEGCAGLLKGESPPPHRSGPEQQPSNDHPRKGHSGGDRKKSQRKKDKEKSSSSSTSGSRSGKKKSSGVDGEHLQLPPPPPATAPTEDIARLSAAPCQKGPQGDEMTESSGWHLCHDEHGNAYYYSEITGESVWAEGGGGEGGATAGGISAEQATQWSAASSTPPPDGWSFHHDPATGHPYYLNDATHESVWAGTDGSFPVEGHADQGLEALPRGEEETDAWAEWDAKIVCEGERPAPTAPPPFSSTQELAAEGEGEGGEGDSLLCTQGVMSTNMFFAARHLEVFPSSSGGSPMASAPPPVESGGVRSSCTPRQPSALAAEYDDISLSGHSERGGSGSDHSGDGVNEDSDGKDAAPSPPSESSVGPPGGRRPSNEVVTNRRTFRLDFGDVTVEDVQKGSHRSKSNTAFSRCSPWSSNADEEVSVAEPSPPEQPLPKAPSSPTVPSATTPPATTDRNPTDENPGVSPTAQPREAGATQQRRVDNETLRVLPPATPPQGLPSAGGSPRPCFEILEESAETVLAASPRDSPASCYPKVVGRNSSEDVLSRMGKTASNVGDVDESIARMADRAIALGDAESGRVGSGDRGGVTGASSCPSGDAR